MFVGKAFEAIPWATHTIEVAGLVPFLICFARVPCILGFNYSVICMASIIVSIALLTDVEFVPTYRFLCLFPLRNTTIL